MYAENAYGQEVRTDICSRNTCTPTIRGGRSRTMHELLSSSSVLSRRHYFEFFDLNCLLVVDLTTEEDYWYGRRNANKRNDEIRVD